MANTHDGGLKIAARHIGISLDEYRAHIEAGESWCNKGRHWSPATAFAKDRSRWNGLKAKCRTCDYARTAPGPSRAERLQARADGRAWCRRCEAWHPIADIRQGLCQAHINEEARARYSTDLRYRAERRQHAHARKRGVAPVPVVGQDNIHEQFDGLCAYCDQPATTWDHILPISKGGKTDPWNIVPACATCNSSKGNRDLTEWLTATGRQERFEVYERLMMEHLPIPSK